MVTQFICQHLSSFITGDDSLEKYKLENAFVLVPKFHE